VEDVIFFKKKSNDFVILVVCTANITRSPYVEALMRKVLVNSGLRFSKRVVVQSAGIKATANLGALHEMTVAAPLFDQVDLTEHRSRKITADMVNSASLILTMEQSHVNEIVKNVPDAFEKTFRITDYGRQSGDPERIDVSDPTGSKDTEEYFDFFGIARTEVNRVLGYMVKHAIIE
jgi:protein-tyrosine-phosphatase